MRRLKALSFLGRARRKRLLLSILAVLVILALAIVFFLVLPVQAVYQDILALRQNVISFRSALSQKDFSLIGSELRKTKQNIKNLESSYRRLRWIRFVPFGRDYYLDGERMIVVGKEGVLVAEILLKTAEPYSDFLGFRSDNQRVLDGAKKAEDRIQFLTESIADLEANIDELEGHLGIIEKNISQVDPQRYPEQIRGVKVRDKLVRSKELVEQLVSLVKDGKPLIKKAGWLLGKQQPARYLFIFQNDGEIRPTGGFWTAYGILEVKEGKIKPLLSEDIYALDTRFNSRIKAPEPIKNYLEMKYWHLRDMNLSPDFKISVETFLENFQKMNPEEFVAVVAIDTQVLVDLLRVLGPIGVPGWGNFKPDPDPRCFGCPQVVYRLELLADKPLSTHNPNRKGFLGPLMHSLVSNILGSPKERIASLAQVLWQNIRQKHILVYFPDKSLQKSAERLGFAGRIVSFEGDYFHFNDSNFGGAKSNLFITQTVKHEYQTLPDGTIKKKVTIKYKNNAPPSDCNLQRGNLCLNGLYRDWFRLYVPEGSKLERFSGSEVGVEVYEELGKTVFEGFFGKVSPLRPNGINKVVFEYRLPFKQRKVLNLLIQKQPGKDSVKHQIWVNGKKQKEVEVSSDTRFEIFF